MSFVALSAALLLASQAAPSIDQVIGRPIGAAINRLGQPTRSFDMEGGLRAFQWKTPATPADLAAPSGIDIYSTPGILSPPKGAVAADNPEKVSAQGCFDTLYAQWALDDWFPIEYAAPPAGCR